MMEKFRNIIKGLGLLCLLSILLSTIAFSEDKTDTAINQTNVTALTSTNASENLTAPLNESKVVDAKTNVTVLASTNASENLTAPLNVSKVAGSAVSSSISTETSSNSWDDAVQSVIRTVESTGQKVESIEVLKLNVKIGENNTII
jgi:hypothetical protein